MKDASTLMVPAGMSMKGDQVVWLVGNFRWKGKPVWLSWHVEKEVPAEVGGGVLIIMEGEYHEWMYDRFDIVVSADGTWHKGEGKAWLDSTVEIAYEDSEELHEVVVELLPGLRSKVMMDEKHREGLA